MAFVASGHITEPSIEDYRDLMRAIAYTCGMGGLAAIVRSAKWSTGYVGKAKGHYDLLACDETGYTGRYGEDGEELIAVDIQPVTWAEMPL